MSIYYKIQVQFKESSNISKEASAYNKAQSPQEVWSHKMITSSRPNLYRSTVSAGHPNKIHLSCLEQQVVVPASQVHTRKLSNTPKLQILFVRDSRSIPRAIVLVLWHDRHGISSQMAVWLSILEHFFTDRKSTGGSAPI